MTVMISPAMHGELLRNPRERIKRRDDRCVLSGLDDGKVKNLILIQG